MKKNGGEKGKKKETELKRSGMHGDLPSNFREI
jgi:hypothetical protein